MKKLLLFSGGMDSTCLLWDELSHGSDIECMWIDYGQKNGAAEFREASFVCDRLHVKLHKICVPQIFNGIDSSILGADTHDIKSAELQNRNAVLINIAAAHCKVPTKILVGAHLTGAGYADCTSKFFRRMAKVLECSTKDKVTVEAPYIRLTKLQLAKRGWEAGMSPEDFKHTVSCYNGNNCGKCPPCRQKAEILRKLFL